MADESNVTGDPSSGYFRDPRARGLKTGRISPRVPRRLPARDRINIARGLVNPGDVDMNQGMLFHPDEVKGGTPLEEIARREGVPTLRPSSSPGFLPGLTGSAKGDVTASEQKIRALQSFQGALAIPNNTIAGSVAHAEGHMTGVAPAEGTSWYADKAADAIQAATRVASERESAVSGVPSHLSAPQMRRSVALFSAQRPWDTGNKQEGSYRISNVENTVNLPAHLAAGGSAKEYKVPAVQEGFPVAGQFAMPQTGDVQEKAASVISGETHPGDPHTSPYDKIATFDSALHFGMTENQALRRHLGNAMVVDTHQARVTGLPDYKVVSNRVGGYDVAAMVNRRAALRAGVKALNRGETPALPIEAQETSWAAVRPSPSVGQMGLFDEDTQGNLTEKNWGKQEKWDQRIRTQMTEGIPEKKAPAKKKSAPKKAAAKKKK